MSEAAALLRDLVALPSVNPMGRPLTGPEFFEGRMADYLESFFKRLGVACTRQAVADGRDNVIGHWLSPRNRSTILFEAHTDTVPVDHMTIDPFAAKIDGGRLYGRGACDVKGPLAAMLAAFARLVRERPADAASVRLACTVDEEHTFMGVQALVKDVQADAAIVAEPTRLRIVHAHKGVVRWHLITPGRSCHSSTPEQGVSAIYRMGHVLTAIERYADVLRASRTDPLLGGPTISVGLIHGGHSVNAVPESCRIEIDRRLIPGEDADDTIAALSNYLRSDGGIDFPFENSPPWIRCPALGPELSAPLVQALGDALEEVVGSRAVEPVAYGTDASSIAEIGIPAVVFGPGDIAQAHTCDEWIDLEQLELGSEVYFRFAAAGALAQ